MFGIAYIFGASLRRWVLRNADSTNRFRLVASGGSAILVVVAVALFARDSQEVTLPPGFLGGCTFAGMWFALRRRVTKSTGPQGSAASAPQEPEASSPNATRQAELRASRPIGGWWRLWILGAISIWLWCGYQLVVADQPSVLMGMRGAVKASGPHLRNEGPCEESDLFTDANDLGMASPAGNSSSSRTSDRNGIYVEFREWSVARQRDAYMGSLCLVSSASESIVADIRAAYFVRDLKKERMQLLSAAVFWVLKASLATFVWLLAGIIMRWVFRGFNPPTTRT